MLEGSLSSSKMMPSARLVIGVQREHVPLAERVAGPVLTHFLLYDNHGSPRIYLRPPAYANNPTCWRCSHRSRGTD
jgi:hypothetical protein